MTNNKEPRRISYIRGVNKRSARILSDKPTKIESVSTSKKTEGVLKMKQNKSTGNNLPQRPQMTPGRPSHNNSVNKGSARIVPNPPPPKKD